jgi:serine/threonine protein phosphatase PrpC
VDDHEINNLITQSYNQKQNEQVIAKELVAAALDNGGRDNVSVIVISATENATEKSGLDLPEKDVDSDTLVPNEST